MHQTISAALDAVSVNCPDAQAFTAVQAQARARMAQGASYAEALIDAQAQHHTNGAPPSPSTAKDASRPAVGCGADSLLRRGLRPSATAGWWVGRKADARNTVTFFRMIGGLAAAVLWLPTLLALSVAWPLPMLPALALAGLGWWRYPAVFRQEA